jgi:hypothetical protein
VLCLYKSNTTPGETDNTASYTEATFTGYANLTLTAASWVVTEGAPGNAAYPQVTFNSTAGSQSESVYGYFLKQASHQGGSPGSSGSRTGPT